MILWVFYFLALKAPNKNCSRRHFKFLFLSFEEYDARKWRLDFSCEQRIHLKHQVLFSLKNNEKYLCMSSAAVVIGALRVNSLQKLHRNSMRFTEK